MVDGGLALAVGETDWNLPAGNTQCTPSLLLVKTWRSIGQSTNGFMRGTCGKVEDAAGDSKERNEVSLERRSKKGRKKRKRRQAAAVCPP